MSVYTTPGTRSKIDWKELFPMFHERAHAESAMFVKRLIKINLSTILCFRGVLPGDCFSSISFGGLNIPIFNNEEVNRETKFFKEWLGSSAEAFDKKYLKSMVLSFFTDASDPSTLFEAYCLTFDYQASPTVSRDMQEIEHISKEASEHLLKSIILTTVMFGKLPERFDFSMKSTYYNNNSDSAQDLLPCDKTDVTMNEKILLGRVTSRFHQIKLTAYKKNFNYECHESVDELSPVPMVEEELFESDQVVQVENKNHIFDCPCGLEENGEIFKVVQCIKCDTWQHTVCFGILDNPKFINNLAQSQHCCTKCISEDNTKNMNVSTRKTLCIIRCALEYCSRNQRIEYSTFQELFSLSEDKTTRLVTFLLDSGVFNRDEEKDTTYNINRDVLKTVMIPYFKPRIVPRRSGRKRKMPINFCSPRPTKKMTRASRSTLKKRQ